MTRVVVTGGSGRLGRSVVARLAADGAEVVSLDLGADERLPVEQEAIDLTRIDDVRATFQRLRPDAVVHLAAIAVPFSAPADRMLTTNVTLAFNVIHTAVELGIPRIITASSPTVIGYGSPSGWTPERLPLDEDSPVAPWNAYSLSKLVVEQIVRSEVARVGDAVRIASFRPCFVIAPEEWLGAPTQQGHRVVDRLDDPTLAAPALFNYVDARDAGSFVSILLDALPAIPNAQNFFVGAADALARAPLSELLPRFVPGISEAAAAALTGTTPAFSIDKARRILGWEPMRSWRSELALAEPTPRELA